MRPTELKRLISQRIKAGIRRPTHIESSPGIGKTQIAAQIARELGLAFRCIHAPLMQAEDYGFPVISADRDNVSFVVCRDKFPLQSDKQCPESGILLIDELPQTDASGQKILANLLQEREIHGQAIKDGWTIITTGNRTQDRSGANRILSHLKNRITTVELDVSIDDWVNWAIEHGVNSEVAAFARFRPNLLNDFDPSREINPTPRAWVEGVSAALGKIEPSLEFAAFKGDVGEGAAAEFCAFLKVYRHLPSLESIVASPMSASVPDDPATKYATVGMLSHNATSDNFAALVSYVSRMTPEFVVMFMNTATRRDGRLCLTQAFSQWARTSGASVLT